VPRNAFESDRIIGEYRVKRTGAGLDLGWTIARRTEVRVGYDAADVRGRVRVGSPGLPEVQGGENAARLLFTFDNQSSPVVPTRGLYFRADIRRYFHAAEIVDAADVLSPDRFWRGDMTASWFKRIRREDRLFLAGGAGTAFGARPIVNDFVLGGPLRLGAFDNDELHGSKYALIDSGYLKHFGRLPDVLGGNIFVGGWLENGTAYDRWRSADWHTNVSLGVIAESLIGPIFVGGSLGSHGNGRIYVSVGPLFR
jgi:NTE family protein